MQKTEAINQVSTIKPTTSPVKFFQQVRQEAKKVTWPTRRETVMSFVMVLVMVTITAAFFFFADLLLSAGVRTILGV